MFLKGIYSQRCSRFGDSIIVKELASKIGYNNNKYGVHVYPSKLFPLSIFIDTKINWTKLLIFH